MKLTRGSNRLASLNQPTIVTVGNFDGIHVGHQEIIHYVIDQGKQYNLRSVILSFEPTPKEFFAGKNAPPRIYSLRDKYEIAKSLQIDHFVCLRFCKSLAKMPAKDFVNEILFEALNTRILVVGDDFRFGHNRLGDIELLKTMGESLGFSVEDKDTILRANTRVSSSLIREKLATGDFEEARSLLGRWFEVSGRVFHGDKKGRTIGFPTANIILNRRITPLRGVFVVTATHENNAWKAVANIGHRPTVNGKRDQLEVHLLDSAENLYGQRLRIRFLARLRDEQKFSSLDELKHQISLDVQQAKEYFSKRT